MKLDKFKMGYNILNIVIERLMNELDLDQTDIQKMLTNKLQDVKDTNDITENKIQATDLINKNKER